MDKKLFGDLVTSLKQAIEISRGRRRKQGRGLAERIREERELLQMTGPRAFRKRRPKRTVHPAEGRARVQVVRKIIRK